jgi:ribonuclease BN (tRNA processing enzyme)
LSGDTAEMDDFWEAVNEEETLDAILIECAFPNELKDIANEAHHLTPITLKKEIKKSRHKNIPIFIVNMKPMYRDEIIEQIADLKIENLHILEVGKIYNW